MVVLVVARVDDVRRRLVALRVAVTLIGVREALLFDWIAHAHGRAIKVGDIYFTGKR